MATKRIKDLPDGLATVDDADRLPLDRDGQQTRSLRVDDFTDRVAASVPASLPVPSSTRAAGFDDFTNDVETAWRITVEGTGVASLLSNGAFTGFPGSGIFALITGTGASSARVLREKTGLVLDATTPIVLEGRIKPATLAGAFSETEFEFVWGLSNGLDGGSSNRVAFVATWDDGTSTRAYALATVKLGVVTTQPVTPPALGGGTGWRVRLTVSTTGSTLEMAVDDGAYAVVATETTDPELDTYHPAAECEPGDGSGDRILLIDWISWSALRAADEPGASGPTGFDVFNPGDVQGPGGAVTDNAVARWDGTTGRLVQGSSVTISDAGAITSGTIAVTGNVTVTGTVDGRDVSADGAKLDTIESGADVTDAANVAAAGAVMGPAPTLTDATIDDGDSPYSLTQSIAVVYVDSSAGDVVIDLPNPATVGKRAWEIWQDAGNASFDITLGRFGSETINGVAGDLLLDGSAATLAAGERRAWAVRCDGTNWRVG
jgi:hypothetical protein